MSELRSALDPLRAEALPDLPDARIEEDLVELQRVAELIEVERLRRIGELDRRGGFERDGHLSMAGWLVATLRLGWGAARDHVRVARALEAMPRTREAVASGEVSMSAARVLVSAHEADPEAFGRAEASMVEAARIHPVADLHRVATFWRQQVERERSPEGDGEAWTRRALHASVTWGGTVRVDGDLDPTAGESLLTALRAVQDSEARTRAHDDERTPAQRRADALGEICRQWLDRGDRPTVGGELPHLTVTVPLDDLRSATAQGLGDAGGLQEPVSSTGLAVVGAELDHTGPASTDVVRQLACDAAVMRVVMSGPSQPLDVGRRTPVIPAAMRRAVIARDRTCRFPTCGRPHTWCDAHHIVHWADGGPTSVSNLLLLCRRHHRLIHRPGGFRLELAGGVPTFTRPDGSPLEGRAPP